MILYKIIKGVLLKILYKIFKAMIWSYTRSIALVYLVWDQCY